MVAVKKNQRATIANVRQMIDAGAGIATSIKAALERNGIPSVSAFALKYRLNRASVANHLSGFTRPTDGTVNALIAELGGTANDWRELLWLAGKPVATA